ncbi:MAG: hypothetical protein AABZ55_00660 [Bdellovibrionota bacterium]
MTDHFVSQVSQGFATDAPTVLRVPGAYHETWMFKFNDPASNRGMWLRFNIHASSNGFRRVAEVWAAYFERSGTLKEVSKTICQKI